MIALGFVGSVGGLRHALGFADELRRRCLVNKEPAVSVAKSLGLDKEQTAGAVRLLRAAPTLSPERAALVVMRDWGMEDDDIAEIFGRSLRWAQLVRERADEIREAEPIPERLEYLDAGLMPGDPSPAEIAERALSLPRVPRDMAADGRRGIRVYRYDNATFQHCPS